MIVNVRILTKEKERGSHDKISDACYCYDDLEEGSLYAFLRRRMRFGEFSSDGVGGNGSGCGRTSQP